MNSIDHSGYHLLNQFAGNHFIIDHVMSFVAEYSLELYIVLFIVSWFAQPKKEIKRRHALVVMGFAGILGLVVNVLVSHIWFRPRPFTVLTDGTFTQLIPHSADASFPSDHTTGSFGFAAGSWGTEERWVSISFTVLAILNGIARVYAGVHWPTDVIAGMLIGIVSGRIMWKFSPWLQPLTDFALRLFRYGRYTKRKYLRS